MSDFRGPLPLDDSDFADVRRKVRARIERRPVAPIVIRLAFAVAAAIALVVIFYPRSEQPVAIHKAVPVVVVPPAPTITVAEAPVKRLHKPHRKPEALVAATSGPPPDSEITMNIQTADPNIRIIWIAQR